MIKKLINKNKPLTEQQKTIIELLDRFGEIEDTRLLAIAISRAIELASEGFSKDSGECFNEATHLLSI